MSIERMRQMIEPEYLRLSGSFDNANWSRSAGPGSTTALPGSRR
jgi:hypothetical protein